MSFPFRMDKLKKDSFFLSPKIYIYVTHTQKNIIEMIYIQRFGFT